MTPTAFRLASTISDHSCVVKGFIARGWGLHKARWGWQVTHLPSGIAAKVNMADQKHALAYVEDLWRLGVRGYFSADRLRHKHQHEFARAEFLSNW